MTEKQEQGHAGAHTPRSAPENGDLVTKLEAFNDAAKVDDLDLFALLEQSAEAGQDDTLSAMARSVTDARRGRGRPLGSKNLRNSQVFDLLEAQGHRAPEHVLSLIQSIDPITMAEMMEKHPKFGQALDRITKAAEALMPYKFAKRTPDVADLPVQARPVIVFNQLAPQQFGSGHGGTLSVSPVPIMKHDAETIDETST